LKVGAPQLPHPGQPVLVYLNKTGLFTSVSSTSGATRFEVSSCLVSFGIVGFVSVTFSLHPQRAKANVIIKIVYFIIMCYKYNSLY